MTRWFDLIFCIGFAFLAIWFCIFALNKGINHIVLCGYYFFFSFFMFGSFYEVKQLTMYCGFLKGYITKSLLYGFCATLALADLNIVPCIIVGITFAIIGIFNFARFAPCCNKTSSGGQTKYQE